MDDPAGVAWELFDGEKQHGPFTEQAAIDAIAGAKRGRSKNRQRRR